MAVGDVISATVATNSLSFQPSAGSEIMITHFGTQTGTNPNCGITDGTNLSHLIYGQTTFTTAAKIFITNSFYLFVVFGGSGNSGYTGIQIK